MSVIREQDVDFMVCWVCGERFADLKDTHYECKTSASIQNQPEDN